MNAEKTDTSEDGDGLGNVIGRRQPGKQKEYKPPEHADTCRLGPLVRDEGEGHGREGMGIVKAVKEDIRK